MKSLIVLVCITLVCQQTGLAQFQSRYSPENEYKPASNSICQEENGKYPHPSQCDAYIECKDGVPQEKLCPDGLLFNPETRYQAYSCQYPIEVSCEGRSNLQPPQSTEECPRSFGYFKLGDEKNCGHFRNCVSGKGFNFECPLGLAFNERTLHCDWPDEVDSCNPEAFLGFTCPEYYGEEFKTYSSPYDCTKYFVCVNGKPRLQACPSGTGFSEELLDCVDIETLPACAAQQNIVIQSGFKEGKK